MVDVHRPSITPPGGMELPDNFIIFGDESSVASLATGLNVVGIFYN